MIFNDSIAMLLPEVEVRIPVENICLRALPRGMVKYMLLSFMTVVVTWPGQEICGNM